MDRLVLILECCPSDIGPCFVRTIEQSHRVSSSVGAQVRISHGHLDRRVAKEFLHGLEGSATHDQVGGEGVAQDVPANVT